MELDLSLAFASLAIGGAAIYFFAGGNSAAAPAAETPAPAAASSGKKGSKSKKQKKEKAPAKKPPPPAAVVEEKKKEKKKPQQPDGNGESKAAKKNKKKKEKKKAAAAASSKADQDSEDEVFKAVKVTPPPVAQAAVEEDGWEVIPDKKKKPKKPKASAAAAADSGSSASVKVGVQIKASEVGVIVGPKGAHIHMLQDATNTKITTPDQSDAKVVTVFVEGDAASVKRCAEAVKELATTRMCAITHGAVASATVQVHQDFFPLLIGSKGAMIRALQDKLGANITMPENAVMKSKQLQYVKLHAKSQANVDKLKSEIKYLMRYYHSPLVQGPGIVHAELDIPKEKYHIVIGSKGQTMKGIKSNTGCEVHIPRDTSINSNVVLVGSASGCEKAKKQISDAIQRYADRAEEYANQRFNDAAMDEYDDDYDDEPYN